MSEKTKFILVRHGETTANAEKRMQGHWDCELNEKGMRQAKAIAERLTLETFTTIYSSDLKRAYQTAQQIAEKTGHDIQIDKQLREINGGILEKLTKEEMLEKYPEVQSQFTTDPTYIIPNGESIMQRYERSVDAINRYAKAHGGETIVVVSHGGVMDAIFRYVMEIPAAFGRRFSIHNASYNLISKSDHDWKLETWGEIAHLSHIGVENKTVM